MQISRRGMLGIIGAGIGAAIVRPGLIMPIKPGLILAPVGLFITAQMIANEFARELYLAGARKSVVAIPSQSHVNMEIPTSERTLPLDQFTARHLRPMAVALAVRAKSIGGPLELPRGVHEGAIGTSGGFAVRYVQDYYIGTDSMISRFDVIHK